MTMKLYISHCSSRTWTGRRMSIDDNETCDYQGVLTFIQFNDHLSKQNEKRQDLKRGYLCDIKVFTWHIFICKLTGMLMCHKRDSDDYFLFRFLHISLIHSVQCDERTNRHRSVLFFFVLFFLCSHLSHSLVIESVSQSTYIYLGRHIYRHSLHTYSACYTGRNDSKFVFKNGIDKKQQAKSNQNRTKEIEIDSTNIETETNINADRNRIGNNSIYPTIRRSINRSISNGHVSVRYEIRKKCFSRTNIYNFFHRFRFRSNIIIRYVNWFIITTGHLQHRLINLHMLMWNSSSLSLTKAYLFSTHLCI